MNDPVPAQAAASIKPPATAMTPSTTSHRSRLSPVEWTMVAAMAIALIAVVLPRLALTRARRNEYAAYYHCYALSRAEQELEKLPMQYPPLAGQVRYASPHVLAGQEDYLPGLTLRTLDGSWQALTPDTEADTTFGYRTGFFLATDYRHWALLVWPREWGTDGEAVFAVTQEGTIRRWDPTSAPSVPWTKTDLAVAAWGSFEAASSPDNDTWQPGWHAVKY